MINQKERKRVKDSWGRITKKEEKKKTEEQETKEYGEQQALMVAVAVEIAASFFKR